MTGLFKIGAHMYALKLTKDRWMSRRIARRRAQPANQLKCKGGTDQPTAKTSAGGPRWYWPVGETNAATWSSLEAMTCENGRIARVETPYSAGRIAQAPIAMVQSRHGAWSTWWRPA